MNKSVEPSLFWIAKDSANGVCGTSPPRMLSSQQIESGMVITAASAPFAFTSSAMRVRLDSALSPARFMSWMIALAAGASGWSCHTASIGLLSQAISVPPAFSAEARKPSTAACVCSHGS